MIGWIFLVVVFLSLTVSGWFLLFVPFLLFVAMLQEEVEREPADE